MARPDSFSRGAESLEDIYASDRFIEQLRVSGTYEPSSRTDAALAAALLTWRDEMREDPITPPPRVDEVVAARPFVQPHRIARRAVAVAGALLAMSSAMATAFDADPLRPVRFLVDIGVTVGERIGHPTSSEDSSDAPTETLSEDTNPGDFYQLRNNGPEAANTDLPNPEVTSSSDDPEDNPMVEPGEEDDAAGDEPVDVLPTDGAPGEDEGDDEGEGDGEPGEKPDPTEPEPTDPTEPTPTDPTEPEPTDPTEPEPTDPNPSPADGDNGEDTGGDGTNPGTDDGPLETEPAPAEQSAAPPGHSGDQADEGTKGDGDSKGSPNKGSTPGDDHADSDADGWPGNRFDDHTPQWWPDWFWGTDTMSVSDRDQFSQKAAWKSFQLWMDQSWNHPGHSPHSD